MSRTPGADADDALHGAIAFAPGGARNAAERTKRSSDPNRPGHARRPAVPQLLAAGAAVGGIARKRQSAGAGEDSLRAAIGIPRQRGAPRPGGRVLRPSWRLAVV